MRQAFDLTPLRREAQLLDGPTLRAVVRSHLGIAPFDAQGPALCPLCFLRSVVDEEDDTLINRTRTPHAPSLTAEHRVNCPCLKGNRMNKDRHDPICRTVAQWLEDNHRNAQQEVHLTPHHSRAIDPNKTGDARADIYVPRTNQRDPVVVDVIVSANYSWASRSKIARYANWRVDTIPAVVHPDGWTGKRSVAAAVADSRDGANGHRASLQEDWCRVLAKSLDMGDVDLRPLRQAILAKLWRGNVLLAEEFGRQAQAAVARLRAEDYIQFE